MHKCVWKIPYATPAKPLFVGLGVMCNVFLRKKYLVNPKNEGVQGDREFREFRETGS